MKHIERCRNLLNLQMNRTCSPLINWCSTWKLNSKIFSSKSKIYKQRKKWNWSHESSLYWRRRRLCDLVTAQLITIAWLEVKKLKASWPKINTYKSNLNNRREIRAKTNTGRNVLIYFYRLSRLRKRSKTYSLEYKSNKVWSRIWRQNLINRKTSMTNLSMITESCATL